MFDDENSIGASFSYDRYARKEGRGLQQAMSYCNDQLVETSRGDYFSPGHTSKYLANAYYVGKIGALKIDFNTDYYWYGDKDRMTIKESVTGEDNQIKTLKPTLTATTATRWLLLNLFLVFHCSRANCR